MTDDKQPPVSEKDIEENSKTDEEASDRIGSSWVDSKARSRTKTISDLTGLSVQNIMARYERGDRRSISDLVLLMSVPEEEVQNISTTGEGGKNRRRQISSSDVLKRFSQFGLLRHDDLRMAEQVHATGTEKERLVQGITNEKYQEKIEHEEGQDVADGFALNHNGLTSDEAATLMTKWGKNELPEKVDPKWLVLLRQFWAPMPIMIWIAIAVEVAIGNYLDMGILLAIQIINASISFYEINKAGNAVAALKSSLKPMATCKRDGSWKEMDAALLVPGDTLLLGSGSGIPADCRVNEGEIDVDQAALTGESLPVTFYKGDSCKMGSTVVRGEVEATVEFTGSNSFFGKTASLLGDNHEHSHFMLVLMKIMMVLVGLSLTLCLINFIYLLKKGVHVKEALSFTIVLLVASIPLAMEIVTNTTLAIGSKKLAHHGAIVAKLSAIEDLAGMSILCTDKTGTLTLNQMVLQDDTPVYCEGETQESILTYAAMAAKWKEPPRDALDRLTLGSVNMSLMEAYEQLDYLPFDPEIKRTEGTVKEIRTGKIFKTSKGAPHIMLRLLGCGDNAIKERVEADVARLGQHGIRSLAIAKNDGEDGEWKMMGLLTFLDPPRLDTKQTIKDANEYGVNVKMITGDHLLIAVNTAKQLDMGEHIFTAERLPMLDEETKAKPADLSKNYGDICLAADGFAQVFPEHKYLVVECLRELGYSVGMTGDGVNDAPALKRADVGIAVAGATDAARAAADLILTEEGLGAIIHGIVIAREIFQRMTNFIIYRISATLQLLLFFFISIFVFRPSDYHQPPSDDMVEPWPEFFHMPVLMLMLITLLNDGTLITIAYDNARANAMPDQWNLPALFMVSSTLGVVSCLSSLVLLYLMLDSWNPDGLFQKLGMDGVHYGQVTTAVYLKVSVSDFLTLFSARTGPHFFFQIPPALTLLCGALFALSLSSILSLVWPESTPDGIEVEGLRTDPGLFGFVWIFSIFFWVLQDVLKVLVYKFMHKVNFNGISTGTSAKQLPPGAHEVKESFTKALKGDLEGMHCKE